MSMAGLRMGLVLALGLVLGVCVAEEVPVFIWGDLEHKSQHANPLEATSPVHFEHLLRAELKSSPLVVVFSEETLSVEDLSRRGDGGASAFPNLRSHLAESLYLPAVDSPLNTLNKIADGQQTKRVRLTENGLPDIETDASFVFVELSDARDEEPRAALLRRHDTVAQETCAALREQRGAALCVYTAHYPSWSIAEEQDGRRTRRQLLQEETPAVTESTAHFYNVTGTVLLYVNSITVSEGSGPTEELVFSTIGADLNNTELTITGETANYTVRMFVFTDGGYWFLDTVNVTSKQSGVTHRTAAADVFAIEGFSYHCSGGVRLSTANSSFVLTMSDFQLQPFYGEIAERFGDSFDCTGFFSVPIWSGLFVVFIMLSIFFYGVMMMMDIRTMDRFDDPKGKTITINASE